MTTPYYSDESVTLYHGRFEEILPSLNITADLIVTDPPYGETSLDWDRWPKGWPSVAAEYSRSMWCFGSMRMFLDQRHEFAAWKYSQDTVWNKNTTGAHAGDRFSRCHEFALFWYQGDWSSIYHETPRVAAVKRVVGDVISRSAVGKGRLTGEMGAHRVVSDGLAYQRTVMDADSVRGGINETEKPPKIIAPLIAYGCPPGGLVLDIFAGSSSTLFTARNLGMRGVGIEMRENQCEKAARRLQQGVLDFGDGAA